MDRDIWQYEIEESKLQIGENAYLEIEWNEEMGYDHRVREYLDIMVVDQSGKWLFPDSYTSYNSQDHDAISDWIIREIIHEGIQ